MKKQICVRLCEDDYQWIITKSELISVQNNKTITPPDIIRKLIQNYRKNKPDISSK